MFKGNKIWLTLLVTFTACSIISCAVNIYAVVHSVTKESSSNTSSSSDTSNTTSGDAVDIGDYVTYFDLAYDAYTKPQEFLDKELTLVGYYSSSEALEDTSSDTSSSDTSSETSSSDTSSETSDGEEKIYHFLTTYGQISECHITVEFTTADNTYPEVGTVIKITGKFTSYEEDGQTYYTIAADTYSTVNV